MTPKCAHSNMVATEAKVTFQVYEKEEGYKDVWLMPYNNKNGTYLDHFQEKTDLNQWEVVSMTMNRIAFSTNAFSPTCGFYLKYGAHGDWGDTWILGDTVIEITAY